MHLKPFVKKNINNRVTIRLLTLSAIMLLSFAQKNRIPERIIFFGDSITEMGTLKDGYISMINKSLIDKGIQHNYELIGSGIGGNKIYDLHLRLEDDVLSRKPDVVVIYVGVNDVWHKAWGTGTDEDKFTLFYSSVIRKIKAQGAGVILCTPAVIGEKTDFSNPMDGDLNQYAQIIRNLAKTYNCKLCDLRSLFLDYNLKNNPENKIQGILTTDRVHLNNKGNQLVADALLDILLKEKH